tara:strand:+ start:365 stop:634 length:270 start_codon:yes stop_codon:yes gene_type:complete
MKIKIELFGAAKDFSKEDCLEVTTTKQINIKELREKLLELLKNSFPENTSYSEIVIKSAFCNENDEIVHDDYLILKDQKFCIIPPIGGG